MNYINILASCNQTLGTCCSDYGTVKILSIYNSVFTILQIVVPILLLVMAALQLTRMLTVPDDKKNMSALTNKFLAATIIFLLPVVLNVILSMINTETKIGKFDTVACLKEAQNSASTIDYNTSNDDTESSEGNVTLLIKSNFQGIDGNPNSGTGKYSNTENGSSSESGDGSVTTTSDGKMVVEYAKKFLGKAYVLGGEWNGEIPYNPTDCAGFVKGIYAHFGYDIPRVADKSKYDSSSAMKQVSRSELQAGDLVLYNEHVAMLTGNGEEIIHASNETDGIKLTNTYAYRGADILAFYRIKGIN